MISLRRSEHEARIEIMPMIDVIFLLLTFFIYAMVLMIPAELLPMDLRQFAAARPGLPAPAVTISLDRAGGIFVDREPVAAEDLLERLRTARARDPETVVYLAAEKAGDIDRLPTFLEVYDRLAYAGLDIRLVGAPKEERPGPASAP